MPVYKFLPSYPKVSKPRGNPSFKNAKTYPKITLGVTHQSQVNKPEIYPSFQKLGISE